MILPRRENPVQDRFLHSRTGARAIAPRGSRPVLQKGFPWVLLFGVMVLVSRVLHAETIPPVPTHYFNDYAGVINAATANTLDRELEQFERDTSNQIVVAVYPRMDSESSVADYTVRVAQSWHVGQKGRDNGAVLFVFVQNRQVYIQVGYGLEPVLPDATCSQIIRNDIVPRFRAGDYTGGLRAGVHAMLAATRNEYHGTGQTVHDARVGSATPHRSDPNAPVVYHRSPSAAIASSGGLGFAPIIFFSVIFLIISALISRRRQYYPRRPGWRRNDDDWWNSGGSSGGMFGGFGGSSGGSSSDSGNFSSGGGNFGGGGAGGSW